MKGWIVLFSLAVAFFSWVHRYPTLPDPDAFFHATMALLVSAGTIPSTFPWLPHTTIATAFADQQLLYHILLVPFVQFLPPLAGVKVASIFFASLAVVSFYFFVRTFAPRLALVATLSLFTAPSFLTRLALGKAQPLVLILFFLFFVAVLRRRTLTIFFLAALAVLTHGSWPILLGIVFFMGIGTTRLVVTTLIGVIAGFILHPAFPQNFSFLWDQTLRIAFFGFAMKGVGAEWYSPTATDIAFGFPLQLLGIPLLGIFFFLALARRRLTVRSLTLFFLASAFLLLTLRARRHLEFFVPFVTLAFVSVLADLYPIPSWTTLWQRAREWLRLLFPSPLVRGATTGALLLALIIFFVQSVRRVDVVFAEGYPLSSLSRVSTAITTMVPKEETIVVSDWSVFPQLFYRTRHHRFLIGLDPRFLFLRDPNRFAAWEELRVGSALPSQILRERLALSYLLVLQEDRDIMLRTKSDTALTLLYEDDEAALFRTL